MNTLAILANSMSEDTGLPVLMSFIALRQVIGKTINTEDARLIESHAFHMGYNEWLTLLENPELHRLITDSSSAKAYHVIHKAKQTLAEKQSLFTMQAK